MATVAEVNAMSKAEQDQLIQKYVSETLAAGGTAADIAKTMNEYGVSSSRVAEAMNVPVAEVQSAYQSAIGVTPTDTGGVTQNDIADIYRNYLGREPDAEGLAYWTEQLAGVPLNQAASQIIYTAANINPANQTPEIAQSVQNAQNILNQQLEYITTKANVGSVYKDLLGKEATEEELAYWAKELNGKDYADIASTITNIAATVAPSNTVDAAAVDRAKKYVAAQQALTSPKLTQQQYNDLAAYFGNDVLPTDQNQINDFVGKKSAFEFANYLATRDPSAGGTGDKAAQVQDLQKLLVPYTNQTLSITTRDATDSETGQVTGKEYYAVNPITGREEQLVDVGDGNYAFQFNELGRANDDPGKTGYYPQLVFKVDPTTNTGAVIGADPNMGSAGGGGFANFLKTAAMVALTAYTGGAFAAAGAAGPGATLGATLASGASPAVQAALGNALIMGVGTGVITGDLEKGIIAAAMAGGGTYLNQSGMLSEAFDALGLKDLKGTFNIGGTTSSYSAMEIADAIQLANQGLQDKQIADILGQQYNLDPTTALNLANSAVDLSFTADNANRLLTQGISGDQAVQTLIQEGIDPVFAQDAVNLLQQGASSIDLANNLAQSGGLTSGNNYIFDTGGGGMLNQGTTTDGSQNTNTTDTTQTPTTTTPSTIPTSVATAGGSTLLNFLKGLTTSGSGLFGNQTAGQLAALIASGALTQNEINKLQELGASSQQQYSNLAQQATQDINFTPYGVTTSLFGTTPTEGGMAGTLTPQGQQLSDAALQAALSSYNQAGTMDLNQMAQERMGLYQQLVGPEQERARLAAEARLAAQGRLGIGAGGGEYAPELKALEDAIAKQNLQFAIQAPQEALAQRTSLLQQGASAAAIPTSLAGQQLQAIQQGGTLGQQAANTAYQRGGLFANITGQGLQDQLTANIAAAQIASARNQALGQALQGAFAPTTQQSGSSSGGGLFDWLSSLTNSSIYGDPALVDYLQANRDPNNII